MFFIVHIIAIVAFFPGSFSIPISSPTVNPDPFSYQASKKIPNITNYTRLNIQSLHQKLSTTLFKVDRKQYGYTLDPCQTQKDCKGNRICLNEYLTKICNGGKMCVCLPRKEEACDIKCSDCSEYPNETCGYLPEDLPLSLDRRPSGMCVSKYVVYQKLVAEVGCESFIHMERKPGWYDLFKRSSKKVVIF